MVNAAYTILILAMINIANASKSDNQTVKSDYATTTAKEEEEMPDIMSVMKDCNETFIITNDYMVSLIDSGSFPDETDKTPKCHVRCILTTTGIMTDNNGFDVERAEMYFGGERNGKEIVDFKDIASECAEKRDEKCKCEMAYSFAKCIIEKEIETYENYTTVAH